MTVGAQLKIALAAATLASLAACGGKSEAEAVDSAKALLAKREYGPAMIELKSALQRSPNSSQVRFLMGEALLAQGDTAAAEVELHKALDLGFDENKVVPLLARAWLIGGKNKELVQTHAHTALRDANAQSQLSAALALAYSQLRMTKEADASIAAALDAAKDNPFTLLAKARILAGGGKSDEALATADKVVAADSTNGEAQMFRGLLLYYAKQDPAGAIQALEIAAKNPQEVLRARPMLISIYIRQKKLDKAKAELDALKAAYPGKGQTLYMEAVVAFVTEDYKRCNVLAEQLLRAAPSNTLFLILGGASDLHLGKFIAAESKLGKVVQTVQGAKEARKLLAETYSRMGQPEKALSVLRPMLEEGKPDAEVLALAGQAYLYLADAKQAQAMLTAASTLKPEDLKLRTSLACWNSPVAALPTPSSPCGPLPRRIRAPRPTLQSSVRTCVAASSTPRWRPSPTWKRSPPGRRRRPTCVAWRCGAKATRLLRAVPSKRPPSSSPETCQSCWPWHRWTRKKGTPTSRASASKRPWRNNRRTQPSTWRCSN